MERQPVTVLATSDLVTAEQLLTEHAMRSLTVLDDQGEVVGVLSRRDILHLLARTDTAVAHDIASLFRRVGTDWEVHVEDGAVTVSGLIQPNELVLAEMAVRTVPGVRSVTVSPD
jgi:CBS domain-containing protein